MKIFAEIIKRDDAKRMVYGYASTEALDSQDEKVTKAAIEDALPDYMRFANVREMHQLSAVGVTKTAEIDEKGLYISAKIVDDAAWEKVKEGVYKGFSIGGQSVSKTDGIITKMKLNEISVVDRPANPEAVIDAWKADGETPFYKAMVAAIEKDAVAELAALVNSGDAKPTALLEIAKREKEREIAVGNGDALPDGSFPIKSADDLKKAISAFAGAKDRKLAKAHIIERANKLGATDQLPGDWQKADVNKGLSTVSWFAQLLDSIACLQSSNAYEQEAEGDDSKMPEELKSWLDTGLKLLADMVDEESAELMGVKVEVIAAAATTEDLAKAGAKFSADSRDKLAKAHGHVKKAAEHMAKARGAPMGEANDHLDKCEKCIGKADSAMGSLGYAAEDKDQANKAVAAEPSEDLIAKATAPLLDRLAKAEEIAAQMPDLLKRLKSLEDQPVPPKGVLRAIGKGDESAPDETEILAKATPEMIAMAQIKKAHRDGGTRIA